MMKFLGDKRKTLTLVLSVSVLIAIGVAAFFYHNEKISFQNISMLKQKKDKNGSNYIRCKLVTNLGNQNRVMMEMAIPYENTTEYNDLNQKIGKIKSDMLTNIDQEKMNEWVKERDFVSIKSELLKIINKHAKKPIKHIYFESFLYQ